MANYTQYLCIYDITASSLRRKVSRVLEGYGARVQKSAFECFLNRPRRLRLWQELEELELSEQDSIQLYQFSYGRTRSIGNRQKAPQDLSHHAVILS